MEILSGLAEGQVLQRNGVRGASVSILGESRENGPIRVTLSAGGGFLKGWAERVMGYVGRGRFKVRLNGIPAGGPYRLTLTCGEAVVVRKAFYVGDVWLLAGQSNMQGVGNQSGAARPHRLVRTFSLRREWRRAADPLHLAPESPDVCHNDGQQCSPELGEKLRCDTPKGVGVGIFFAREMLRRTSVPQGLICAAKGGTSMRQWSPGLKKIGQASLYASMLRSVRITGQPVAGILWYQGESEANSREAPLYTKRMKRLVAEVRRDLRQPRLPWFVVQLARHFTMESPDSVYWNLVQEQQRLLPSQISHLETVAAVDLPMDDFIHVGSGGFPILGKRLASAAARLILRDSGEKKAPQMRRIHMHREPRSTGWIVEVAFDFVEGKLEAEGEPQGFCAVNRDGKWEALIYKTTLRGNIARLHMACDPLQHGLRIGYGLGFSPVCNITDARKDSLLVFGPSEIEESRKWLPFVTTWKVTDVLPASRSLRVASLPEIGNWEQRVRTYEDTGGFVNEHSRWMGRSGHVHFSSCITLSAAMKLEFLMGYDGPFCLWLDGGLLFSDLHGVNPAYPDKSRRTVALNKGLHRLHVAMDTNAGLAWGFFLRFRRRDTIGAASGCGTESFRLGYSV